VGVDKLVTWLFIPFCLAEFHPREEVVEDACAEEVEHLLSDTW